MIWAQAPANSEWPDAVVIVVMCISGAFAWWAYMKYRR